MTITAIYISTSQYITFLIISGRGLTLAWKQLFSFPCSSLSKFTCFCLVRSHNGCMWEILKLNQSVPSKAWLKKIFMNNHYKTIYRPVRSEYSSCRVFSWNFHLKRIFYFITNPLTAFASAIVTPKCIHTCRICATFVPEKVVGVIALINICKMAESLNIWICLSNS